MIAVLGLLWLAMQAHRAGYVDLGPLAPERDPSTGTWGNEDAEDDPGPDAAGDEGHADDGGDAGPDDGPLRLLTWNIANLGRSKSQAEIALIADVIVESEADVVAVQEVVASEMGPEAVDRVGAALEARGGRWNWSVSNRTSGRPTAERFAFFWRPDRALPQGSFWLEPTLASTFDREPFMGRFALRHGRDEPILVAAFHAPPTSRDPERELTLLPALHRTYPDDDLVLVGDFNLDAQRSPFDGLRDAGFDHALRGGARTTLKAVESPSGEHLASAYDNVFYEPDELRVVGATVLDFSPRLPTLRDARNVSDHLPVLVEFAW